MTRRAMAGRRRQFDKITFGTLLACLWIPLLGLLLGHHGVADSTRRAPAPEVALDLASLSSLPYRFQEFFEDSIGFRSDAVRCLGLLKRDVLHVSPSRKVLLGANGWLYLRGDALRDYRSERPFTEAEVAAWKALLERRASWLASRGTPYLFLVAPNKHTIYPEYLPGYCLRAGDASRLDALVAVAGSSSAYSLVDPRAEIIEAKREGRAYHRTDSHWNAFGAFAAYRKVADRLAGFFPDLQPLAAEEVGFSTVRTPGGDLARIIGLKYDILEDCVQSKVQRKGIVRVSDGLPVSLWQGIEVKFRSGLVTECDSGEVGKAVVFYDSFGEYLVPLLARHFRRAVFVHRNDFDPEVVVRVKPDVVIQQLVERRLMNWRPHDPLLGGASMR